VSISKVTRFVIPKSFDPHWKIREYLPTNPSRRALAVSVRAGFI
jgi:hypothetical protein